MKRVVLIGDSIRMGYQDGVRGALADVAEVWAPAENGGTSKNVLANLEEWVLARSPAVVHLNCGLHDIKRNDGENGLLVPASDYERNLRDIFGRIHAMKCTKLLWASTTPVNEERHHAQKAFDRFEADVQLYNDIALGVAREYRAPVNDLYAAIAGAGRDELLSEDGVHFTDAGYARLAQVVAGFIRSHLDTV